MADRHDVTSAVVDNSRAVDKIAGMSIPMPPISEADRRQMARFRSRIEEAGLAIEEIDEIRWRVSARGGESLLYFPLEDRWRKDRQWGPGTLTLIRELKGSG